MAKLKEQKQDLEALLAAATGGNPKSANQPANVPAAKDIIEDIPNEPLFTIDKEDEMKKIRKKARNSIKEIARAVLTKDVLKTPAIQDKIETDASSLVGLYWQIRVNIIMQDAMVDSIAKGNMSPRMIEVFTNLSDKIASLEKQLLATQVQIRKNYIDYKSDIMEVLMEERTAKNQKQLDDGKSSVGSTLHRGTKDLISQTRNKMIEDAKVVDFKNDEK